MSVLTVVDRETGAVPLARLGFRIARALEEDLVILCLDEGRGEAVSIAPGDPVPEGASAVVTGICSALARGADRPVELSAVGGEAPETGRLLADPRVEVRWLRVKRRLPAVLTQIADVGATHLVAANDKSKTGGVTLERKLFTAAPCHVVLARLDDAGETPCRRILVPTAGGPHAGVALRLGERLASAEDGEVVALYVGSDEGEFAREVGQRRVEQAVAAAGVAPSRFVTLRAVLADDRSEAIARVAAEGFDLLLLGDSNAGSLRRRLFGTVPERLLAGEDGLKVAVVRREWKLLHRLRRQLGRWLDLTIPQMARADRIALYEKLQSGSEWNFDFMTLIGLSTAIAALGLIQDSGAVVIGAMLVAPLMTPILGAGLALVQGNYPLLRISGNAIFRGYLIALLIGYSLGLAVPVAELTPQLLARGGPTLLDLGVAFFSGLAAAFCLGRPGLSAALPGVAIAAALVPPIATTGVCLAIGELVTARGAALLFGTNVVAIILGAAVSLYAGGVRGKRGAGSHQRWVRHTFLALLLGVVALTFPLGSGLRSQLSRAVPAEVRERIEVRLSGRLESHPETRVLRIAVSPEPGGPVLEIEIASPAPLSPQLAAELAGIASGELESDHTVRISTRLAVEAR